MNVARARSAWARTAIVMPGGTRWRTTTVAPWYVAIASAKRIASSAWGPPRTGTRTRLISREPRCLTTAMSHGDSRTTSSMVGEKTVGPPLRPSLPIGALPPQPKMMRSASCSADASMMPSAACRPMRTIGWIGVPFGRVVEDLLEQPSGVPGARRALGQRHALGHLDDAKRGQLAGLGLEHRGAEPDQLLGRARVGDRDQDARRAAAIAGSC